MKAELVDKVSLLHKALMELNDVWNCLDWSVVPEIINEHYPFHQDLVELKEGTANWLETIKNA